MVWDWGLVTGFLARAGSLAVRPASLMCVLFPTFSDYSPAIPGIRLPQAGNPLSLRAMPYPPRERCARTRSHVHTRYVPRVIFSRTRVHRMRVRVRIEVQQPPGPVGSREREKDGGKGAREGEAKKRGKKRTVPPPARLLDEGPVS